MSSPPTDRRARRRAPGCAGVLFVVAGLATVAARAAINANNQSFRD